MIEREVILRHCAWIRQAERCMAAKILKRGCLFSREKRAALREGNEKFLFSRSENPGFYQVLCVSPLRIWLFLV